MPSRRPREGENYKKNSTIPLQLKNNFREKKKFLIECPREGLARAKITKKIRLYPYNQKTTLGKKKNSSRMPSRRPRESENYKKNSTILLQPKSNFREKKNSS